MNPLFI